MALGGITYNNLPPVAQRGGIDYLPTWQTVCGANPTVNALMSLIDSHAQAKNEITVGFEPECDYVCDGIDDHVEIQQALDAAAANILAGNKQSVVRLRNGIYQIGTFLQLWSGIYIVGEGWKTILKLKNLANTYIFVTRNTVASPLTFNKDQLIMDVAFDCNGVNNATRATAVRISDNMNFTMARCKIDGYTQEGVWIYGNSGEYTKNVDLTRNYFDNGNRVNGVGIKLGSYTVECRLDSNISLRGWEGIEISSSNLSTGHRIINNIARGNELAGMFVSSCRDAIFEGNQTNENFGHGLQIFNSFRLFFGDHISKDNSFVDTANKYGYGAGYGTNQTYDGIQITDSVVTFNGGQTLGTTQMFGLNAIKTTTDTVIEAHNFTATAGIRCYREHGGAVINLVNWARMIDNLSEGYTNNMILDISTNDGELVLAMRPRSNPTGVFSQEHPGFVNIHNQVNKFTGEMTISLDSAYNLQLDSIFGADYQQTTVDLFLYAFKNTTDNTVGFALSRVPYGRFYRDFSVDVGAERGIMRNIASPIVIPSASPFTLVGRITVGLDLVGGLITTPTNGFEPILQPVYESKWHRWAAKREVSGTGTLPSYGLKDINKYKIIDDFVQFELFWRNTTGGTSGSGTGAIFFELPLAISSIYDGDGYSGWGSGQVYESGGTTELITVRKVDTGDSYGYRRTARLNKGNNSEVICDDQSSAARSIYATGGYSLR